MKPNINEIHSYYLLSLIKNKKSWTKCYFYIIIYFVAIFYIDNLTLHVTLENIILGFYNNS